MQHRDLVSELLQPHWGRTMCWRYVPIKLRCLSSYQGSGKEYCGAKQKVFHSRNTKPNCNSDLAGYPKILAHKWGRKHSPNRVQNSLAVQLGPGLLISQFTRNQCEGLHLYVLAVCGPRGPWFAANPPGAQLLCRGATVCKLASGKQRGRDVQALILSKYLWHQQPLYNDYSYLIPQFDCVIKNLFITWLPGFWGQHNKSLGIARASVFVSDLQGSATKH